MKGRGRNFQLLAEEWKYLSNKGDKMPANKNTRILFLLLLLFSLSPALANDTAVQGIGGAIVPMHEHQSIRMLKERVTTDLFPDRAEVNCLFTFQNLGPAATVRMGFPESGRNMPSTRGFTHFTTWVDGLLVPARIRGYEEDPDGGWQRWRVKTVHFSAKQRRVVCVRYGMKNGDISGGGRFFKYTLGTGAYWKGTIGRAEIIVNLRRFPWYWNVDGNPEGYQRKGNQLEWIFRDFKPGTKKIEAKEEFEPTEISVFFNPGYEDIYLDNEKISPYNETSTFPQLKGSQVGSQLGLFSDWVDGEVEWNERTSEVTLKAQNHVLVFRANERNATLDGRLIQLKEVPRLRQHRHYICVNEIITLLGGTARFDKKTSITYLTLPQK